MGMRTGCAALLAMAGLSQFDPVAAQTRQTEIVGPEADSASAECRSRQDAARISGEIVVCARPQDQEQFRTRSRGQAQADYAAATKDAGDARAPDFRPPPCRPSLISFCPKFGKPPPPSAPIDLAALPEAPPGSDADRAARGLAPKGDR